MVFVEEMGAGESLVLVHGWGMHGGLLRDLATDLSARFRVFIVDLPGHGKSEPLPGFELSEVLERLRGCLPASAHWVGWSLGGLVSIAMAASEPERVKSLSLISSSPRFIECDSWPGVSRDLLTQMGRDFVEDYQATLARFVGLQVFGQEGGRRLSRHILSLMALAPPPDTPSLLGALGLLRDLDLRTDFATISQPILSLYGGRDRLVSPRQSLLLEQLHPALAVKTIENAAHLPFLTHSEEVLGALLDFWGVPKR